MIRAAIGTAVVGSLFLATVSAWAGNATVPGEFIVEPPTLRCLGFEWLIDGDDNRNGKVTVSYRKKGDGEWRQAQPLLRIHHEVVYRRQPGKTFRCGNMYAGSILNDGFTGKAPDLGAHELGSPLPVYGPRPRE